MELNSKCSYDTTSTETENLIRITGNYMTRKQKICYFLIPCCITLVVGFLIGFLCSRLPYINSSRQNINNIDSDLLKYYEYFAKDINESYFKILQKEVNSSIIRQNLKELTKTGHLAGTKWDYDSAIYVHDKWQEQNLDYVKIIDYNVLLSYPDKKTPNSIQFLNEADVVHEYNITEPVFDVDKDLNHKSIPFPFLAYTLNGSVTSDEIYYINYCSKDDFEFITKELNYNIEGKIVMCRYGKEFRGDKILRAQKYGATGVILYDDPIRSAPDVAKNEIYPNGEFLPGYGTQRGTSFIGIGDPETPLYPSDGTEFREEASSNPNLPNITAQVIGYKLAQRIFENLKNNMPVKTEWAGQMNIKYTYGGKLLDNQKLRINVYNKRKVGKIYNVIGMIRGAIEPDRYVMIGNHRDTWTFGAIDPLSGQAILLEISRALSLLRKHGWQPRRSILFLSWGAEEYGLLGSTEWVEEFNKKLSANAVAYLNLDTAIKGNYSFIARASPLLQDIIYNVTRKVNISNEETVFDRWLKFLPNSDKNNSLPLIQPDFSGGSDFASFQQRVGIPCMDSSFIHDHESKYSNLADTYALYHTSYETFRLVDKFIDPGFNSSRLLTIITAEIARTLSDSKIIPFKPSSYTKYFKYLYKNLVKKYGQELDSQKIYLNDLAAVIEKYKNISTKFEEKLKSVGKNYKLINQFNEQLRNIERSFLIPEYIQRKGYMNAIAAPSLVNHYGYDGFPGLTNAIDDALLKPEKENWDKVKSHLSIAIYAINSVCKVLDSPDSFER